MKHNLEVSANARRTQYFQVFLMGVSAFIMNTTEFVPVALLSDIAQDFSITTAETGWMLTLYAWIVAAMSLPLMLLTSRFERKSLLLGLFVVFIASHVYSIYHLLEALIGILSAFYIPCNIVYPLGTKDRQNAK